MLYIAPERFQMTSEYTVKADVWSFGLTMLEIALGA